MLLVAGILMINFVVFEKLVIILHSFTIERNVCFEIKFCQALALPRVLCGSCASD